MASFFNNDWDEVLGAELDSERFNRLLDFVRQEYIEGTVFPPKNKVFRCFKLTTYKDTHVVILGQDPYHEVGQANGLCFAVNDGTILPPSLVNICKELSSDLEKDVVKVGDLSHWARQGVLMMNAVLTVKQGIAASHAGKGWEEFTDAVIKKLNEKQEPVIFILWGGYARRKKALITNPIHSVIESAHPSPLSAFNGFFGSKPFSRCNDLLVKNGYAPIIWDRNDWCKSYEQ